MAKHAYTTPALLPATDLERGTLLPSLKSHRSLLGADRNGSPGPVTLAIRGVRPNEMPSWEIREAEMRRQEAADLRALRLRVARAVTVGIDFLDATGGDCDIEEDAGEMAETDSRYGNLDDEPSLCGIHVKAAFANAAFGDEDLEAEHDGREPSLCGISAGPGDDGDREDGDDNGLADIAGGNEQRCRYLDMGGDRALAGSAF